MEDSMKHVELEFKTAQRSSEALKKLRNISNAIHIMCDALEGAEKKGNRIVMSTFGGIDGNRKCIGCAATMAMLTLFPDFTEELEARSGVEHLARISSLEFAFNDLRLGTAKKMSKFLYGYVIPEDIVEIDNIHLRTGYSMSSDNWKELLPVYRKWANQLHLKGY